LEIKILFAYYSFVTLNLTAYPVDNKLIVMLMSLLTLEKSQNLFGL